MKKLFALAALLLAVPAFGQAWSGILATDRATDWTYAGVAGGIPARTSPVCASLTTSNTAAQINSAIQACSTGVVNLAAGTYNFGTSLLTMKSGVTVRGAGANLTKIRFTGTGSCPQYGGANVCFSESGWIQGGYSTSPQYQANWTAGYTSGTSVITLSTVNGLSVGDTIILDQVNDSADSAGMYVCNTGGVCAYTDGGGDVWGGNRHQRKVTTVAAINGTQVTLATPLSLTNWRSGQAPRARWNGNPPISYAGLENMTIDATSYGYESSAVIGMLGAADCWVKGVRVVGGQRAFLQTYQATRITIRDSYFNGGKTGVSESYGIELYGASSDVLVENNILQHITAPIVVNDGGERNVIGYNFTIDNYRADATNLMSASYHMHSPGVGQVLLEGNSGTAVVQDNWYGTVHFVTLFRNHLYGDICSTYLTGCPTKNEQTSILQIAAYSRFFNFVGNVLGRSGYYNTYESPSLSCNETSIYCFGYSHANGGVTDAQTKPRAMRWGNYDTVSAATRFVAGEVPSGLTQFANPVPATQTLPASFYLPSKPAWFGSIAWPAVGPDVTGGNIAGYGGYANKNPARVCFESLAVDTAYPTGYVAGASQVRQFDAATCYSGVSVIKPNPPTNVIVTQVIH